MSKILVADDEQKIREMIARYARHEGHEVKLASDGQEALALFAKEDFDVVILDIMMPKMDGYETLRRMQAIREVHCLFLSALGQEDDRVYGFDVGGEDYVTKPFSLRELMLRINVILKRERRKEEKIVAGGLIIDLLARQLVIDGQKRDLANKEFELLVFLAENRGRALSREMIINKVWGYEYNNDDRTLDTHIKLLRRDLGAYGCYITTIRGVGYRFEKDV